MIRGGKVGIVGAGFAGVALAYYLTRIGFRNITIFDPLGIGGLSANLPVVLCHPYPSRMCIRTKYAHESLECVKGLIEISERVGGKKVAFFTGLERLNAKPKVLYSDLEKKGNSLIIHSGFFLAPKPYLEGLFKAAPSVVLEKKMVESVGQLANFDTIVLCLGGRESGLSKFLDAFNLDRIKGQMLLCFKRHCLVRPRMDTLHEIPVGENIILGSTYEREYVDLKPDKERALKELRLRKKNYPFHDLHVKKCFSSCRLSRKSPEYLPICSHLQKNIYAFTALGSRGAIYHAYFAREMARLLIRDV